MKWGFVCKENCDRHRTRYTSCRRSWRRSGRVVPWSRKKQINEHFQAASKAFDEKTAVESVLKAKDEALIAATSEKQTLAESLKSLTHTKTYS